MLEPGLEVRRGREVRSGLEERSINLIRARLFVVMPLLGDPEPDADGQWHGRKVREAGVGG